MIYMFRATKSPIFRSTCDCIYIYSFGKMHRWGTAVAQWLRCCATNRKVAGSIPAAGVIGLFIDIKFFRSHYGPGVDSASNKNEYPEHFLGVKGSRCVRLTTYHHPVPLSWNLGTLTSWNPLEHSWPVRGLLYLTFTMHRYCCRPVTTLSPVGSNIGALYQSSIYTLKGAPESGRVCRPKHVEQIQIDQ